MKLKDIANVGQLARHVAVAAIAAATALIGSYEGLRTYVYRDSVGVATYCYGETTNVVNRKYTKEECDALLAKRVVQFSNEINKCIITTMVIPDKSYEAFLSLAYNIGSQAFCGSTLMRKLNANDLLGACNAIVSWNRAGGKVLLGLTRRRVAERSLCLEGMKENAVLPAL